MTHKNLLKICLAAAVAMTMSPAVWSAESINTATCVACHSNIGSIHDQGKHKNVACTSCHSGLEAHQKAPGKETRPTTSMDPMTCGACHPNQLKSAYKVNTDRVPKVSKKLAAGPAPDPFFDRALGGHGFTKEHAELRSHTFMALDQYICDRAFGDRFEPKDGWLFAGMDQGPIKVWDVIRDKYPDDNLQKPRRPGTAAAGNPVCWSCKSTDLILDWAYMGDNLPGTTFSRESAVVDIMRKVNHAVNCNFCHDPHSTQPRVTRDALIQAITRTDFPSLYSEDPNKTKFEVVDYGVRGFPRKVAILEKYDTKLQCGQCHVEYNCNPGTDPATGKAVGMKDIRTNVFPFVGVEKIDEFYKHISFKDFKHNRTGALLTKMQHPDVETFYGSKHQKAGADCKDCHMPKMKDENGQVYTSHWVTSPHHYMEETCLKCHKDKTAEQLGRSVTSMRAYFNGKVREAESRMNDMFDAFNDAIDAGVSEEVLNKAREQHSIAHTNWEWWTAVNGAWFHNPQSAALSLAKSGDAANAAVKILRDAIRAKNKPAEVAAAK